MSMGFDIVCDECKVFAHAGIRSGSGAYFGYASTDEDGRRRAATFMFEHAWHGRPAGVRVVLTDDAPVDGEGGWREVRDEEIDALG